MRYHSITVFSLTLFGGLACVAQTPVPLNVVPSRIVGHPNSEQNSIASANPNLVEGREMFAPQGIALDTSVSPNILYVSDTSNHRILAWKNAAGFANGDPANLVIGQTDFFHTGPQGTGSNTGLTAPTGLAVSGGDLYIADSGNNRVLRFRKPFQNQGNLFPDLFIGQPNLSSRTANNNGTGQAGQQGVAFTSGNQAFQVNMAFDASGDLWLTDPGNRRVLRFAKADVTNGGGPLTANLVLGNLGVFNSVQPSVTPATATLTNLFATPGAIGFDPSGRLFVSDSDTTQNLNRVLVFLPPFSNSSAATRIMGIFPPNSQAPSADQNSKTIFFNASSIFFIPGSSAKVGLLDQGYNRILLFDSFDKWPDQNTSYSPQATTVLGQTNFTAVRANGGTTFTPAPTASTFNNPTAAVFSGNDLYIADSLNHRVLDLPLQGSTFGPATRVLGQDRFDMSAPNLIEGKEFAFVSGNSGQAGIAVDSSGDTPHLYVADTFNNRVLGFNDVRRLKAGARADIVIGQQDFNSGLCNGTGDPNRLTNTTICLPAGLLVDANGNLYVADSGNGRVLRFPAPFAHKGLEQADLVLGQHNFVSKITDPTPFTMSFPYGLSFVGNNGLLVSDLNHNRVLFFPFSSTTSGTFDPNDSGKAATKVLGQPDFVTITTGNTDAKMSAPLHVAADTDGRPYIVDANNGRVLIFDTVNSLQSGSSAAFILGGVGAPRGIYMNSATGEFWVTDASNTLVRKFPKFQSLLLNSASNGNVQSPTGTLAVVQDQYGDLIVADASNRVGFYFPGLQAMNGASFIPGLRLAPGMFASICAAGSNCAAGRPAVFGANIVNFSDLPNPLPMPTTLDNVQVTFNDQPVPLYYVSPSQINFYVPMGAPTSGTVDMEVVQTTTGRVYAAGTVGMNTYSPAIVSSQFPPDKLRQAAVINQDNTINSPTNPAPRGSIVTIYAVGQGFVPNAPPDGTPAPSNPPLETPFIPRVIIKATYVDEYTPGVGDPPDKKFVKFSGLAPGLIGVWQINVQIPANVDISSGASQISLIVTAGSLFSIDSTFVNTIAVK